MTASSSRTRARSHCSASTAASEDVVRAGDAYYMAPGHVPVVEEDCFLIELSPAGEYQKTMAALEE